MEQGIEAEIAAWLGVDLTDPVQRLANDLARGDREFLDHLVEHRRLKFTQSEVAERMGISQSAVSQFESGDRDPQLSTVRRYALALELMIEHKVVERGRAELIRDEGLRARAELMDARPRGERHLRPLATIGRGRPLIDMDAQGPLLPAARLALP